MKKSNLNWVVVIAVCASSYTVTANAKNIGSRIVTACFAQIQLTNGAASPTTLNLPIANRGCTQTELDIIAGGTYWLNAVPSSQRTGCQPNLDEYCYLEFDVDASAPSGAPNIVPQTGYASGKYKVLFDGLALRSYVARTKSLPVFNERQ